MQKKTRSMGNKLTLRRETLQRLQDEDLGGVAGATNFTTDCTVHPSHCDCSLPCSFSCLP